MTNAGQPESVAERLNRLETLFADIGDVVLAQTDAINALTANINNLADQAAQDRQQAAQDRQQAAQDRQQAVIDRQQANQDRLAWQAEIQRIWDYLLRQSGNGRQGN